MPLDIQFLIFYSQIIKIHSGGGTILQIIHSLIFFKLKKIIILDFYEQGVTLEDLKSAEQLVKKKQQQENQQRTTELQQLVTSEQVS